MATLLRWGLLSFLIATGFASSVGAQNYPVRPVKIVVPIGAGGPLDITARVLGAQLAARLGQPFVIENRPGGGTVVGALAVAKADPDGYTLLVAPNSTLTTNVTIFKKLAYDPEKDFIPIALLAKVPFVLVSGPSQPSQSIADLVAAAKKDPGKLSYASPGLGTTPHLAAEMLKSMTGIQMSHVPYRGAPAAVADVVAGHVQMTFSDPANARPLLEERKLRALGVSSAERVGLLPQVPTLAEAGLPGFEAVAWNMILAPANTPKNIVDKLHEEVKAVMSLPEVRAQIAGMGLLSNPTPSVAELQQYLRAEIDRWGKAVKQAGLAETE